MTRVTLVAFTIPDDPAQLPGWLESRLVAPDFARFVAELSATHPDRSRARVPARQLMGDWYRKALAEGLGGLPVGVLQQLLRHPKCLLELQEAVLTEGGAYWDEVANRADEMAPAIDRGRAGLGTIMTQANPDREGGGGTAQANPEREGGGGRSATPSLTLWVRPERSRSYVTWAVASSALAACLLIAVGYLTLMKKPDTGPGGTETAAISWGWAKPGGIPQGEQKPAEYLNALAAASEEWFNKRPEDAAGVAKRIHEFRTGCSRLIFSPHTQLAQNDKEWLVERCRVWAKKLDDHLAALEAGADPLKVRKDADDTINSLQDKLRERAMQVG